MHLHILLTPLPQVTTLVMAAVCLIAAVVGRWPERVGASVVCFNWCASTLVQDYRWFHHGQPAIFALDAAMLAALTMLALACRRTWVLWAAAFALLLNAVHAAVLSAPLSRAVPPRAASGCGRNIRPDPPHARWSDRGFAPRPLPVPGLEHVVDEAVAPRVGH